MSQHRIDLRAAREWVKTMRKLGVSSFSIGNLQVNLQPDIPERQPRIGFGMHDQSLDGPNGKRRK